MIRRPMMYLTSSFCVAIICWHYLNIVAMAPLILCAMAFFISKKEIFEIFKESIIVLIIIAYFMGIMCAAFNDFREMNSSLEAFSNMNSEGNQSISVLCKIVQSELRNTTSIDGKDIKYIQLTVKVISVDEVELSSPEKLLIKYYEETLKTPIPGQIVIASGDLQAPQRQRNPGCFDYALYLESVGIKRILVAETLSVYDKYDNAFSKISSKLYSVKEEYLDRLENAVGTKTAGLMRAIMFGEKNDLDDELYEEFQTNGTAHVLAVSGLHVGIIYGFIATLWRGKKGKLYFVVIMVFFLAYMFMASFASSVVRAVIMVWLHIFANMSGRRYDMISAAFFVALIMMIGNPMIIFNGGFQMSFMAVLTLSLLLPIINKWYDGIFTGSIAVQIGLLPYMIYSYNYVSIVSIFINIPIIFLTGIIVPAGLCCMAAMIISDGLFQLISAVIFGLCHMMSELNGMTGIEGITVFMVRSPPLVFVAAYYLSLLFFVSEEGRLLFIRKKKKILCALIVFITSMSLAFGMVAGNDFKKSEVVFVDVGQGDCIHFRTKKGGNYLIDGGGSISYNVGKKTLKPYLLKNGAKTIDGAFVTHLHTDHYKGIIELCKEGMIEKLFLYEGYKTVSNKILAETGMTADNIIYLSKGQVVSLGRDISVNVLWPERHTEAEYEEMNKDESDENEMSLIFKITHENKTIIATGDVDSECLTTLAKEYGEGLEADILKVAHHGSKYSDSEEFVKEVSPEYAVFQVGKNNFGHPNKGVVEKFRQEGIMIYRNDEDGAVAFDFGRNDKIKVRTVKGEKH